ncbi:prepilin peptidase [Alkalihalobacillus pseudalcaliphilus]|uniref:prepilin peptidase n=1 Tax=Alkalihalobacillus pseudalcaliphilus TaxID=79884 RepID=UPI00064DBB06|nr:A24 family peptidase [Alkalihalobacillus pseudalcaliphilus]KMK74659.1 prepilin peptidase [Alkalihalobacillus pseudalcaliphilus]
MEVLLYLYIGLIGLCLGSFFNVVGLRLPKGNLWTRSRSYCPSCERTLKARDLYPVFSYIFLRGACRTCRAPISPLYPSVELMTATLFVFAYWQFGLTGEWVVSLILISLLMIVVVTDLRYMLIPDKLLLFFAPFLLVFRLFIAPFEFWWQPLLGSAVGFSLLLLIAIISKGGMGGGDIKLFAVLGLTLGWEKVLLTFMFACLIGALMGGILLLLKKVKRKQPIPFGPFIVAGALISYFYGMDLIHWYRAISGF